MISEHREKILAAGRESCRDLTGNWYYFPVFFLYQLLVVYVAVEELYMSIPILLTASIAITGLFVALAGDIGFRHGIRENLRRSSWLSVYMIGVYGILSIPFIILAAQSSSGPILMTGISLINQAIGVTSPYTWFMLVTVLLSYAGHYFIAQGYPLRRSVHESITLPWKSPLSFLIALIGGFGMTYAGIMALTLPFLIVEPPSIGFNGLNLPLSLFTVMAGVSIGGCLGTRFTTVYLRDYMEEITQ